MIGKGIILSGGAWGWAAGTKVDVISETPSGIYKIRFMEDGPNELYSAPKKEIKLIPLTKLERVLK